LWYHSLFKTAIIRENKEMIRTVKNDTTPIQDAIEIYKNEQNAALLSSVNKHGLVPLSSIPKSTTVNFVFGSQDVHQNICVNYLKLAGKRKGHIRQALKVAIWEEYMGVAGISLERGWPFLSKEGPAAVAEIQERLMSNIVFVLSPPKKQSLVAYPIGQAPHITNRKECYELQTEGFMEGVSSDGMSHSRGQVLTDNTPGESDYVTEVKTKHHFSHDEILAILVPEDLIPLAQSALSDLSDKIQPVSYKEETLVKIPDMLRILHQETLATPFTFRAPDYESALIKTGLCNQNFSLHAIRLMTSFDIMPRYCIDLEKHHKALTRANAQIVHQDSADSGWYLVHQSKVMNQAKNIKTMQRHIRDFRTGDRVNLSLRKALINSKGNSLMNRVWEAFSQEEQVGFTVLGISCISTEHFSMIAYPSTLLSDLGIESKDLRKTARLTGEAHIAEVETRLREEKAATTIQAFVRGCLARKALPGYKAAIEKEENLSASVDTIENELRLLQERLEAAKSELENAQQETQDAYKKFSID